MRAAAFLRAVNVGGRNLVPMPELKRRLGLAGFTGVHTYLQSGNVAFNSKGTTDAAAKKLEELLGAWLGFEVKVMVRSLDRLRELLQADPFAGHRKIRDVKLYVGFLAGEPASLPELPYVYGKDGLELVGIEGRDAFIVSKPLASGMSGYPNLTLEKALGVASTTRNWNTIERILRAEDHSKDRR
jgi:uncharacterized protein (DUF1697 family)